MSDLQTARIYACRQNLDQYCRLLAGHLTDVERRSLHGKIVEERLELERLEAEANSEAAFAYIAAQLISKNGRSQK